MNEDHFKEHDIVTLHNPDKEDFTFLVQGKSYLLPAGQSRQYLGYMAELCLKHLVDKMMIKDGREKELLFEVSRKEYEDKIVQSTQSIDPTQAVVPEAEQTAKAYEKLNELPEDKEEDDPTPFNLDSLPKDEDLFPAPKKEQGDSGKVGQVTDSPAVKPRVAPRANS